MASQFQLSEPMQSIPSNSPAGANPLVHCLEGPITAMSLVGTVGVTTRVVSVFERTQSFNTVLAKRLARVLEAEVAYLDHLLDFMPASEPEHPAPRRKEMSHLATLFDMHQAICVVACNTHGDIVVGRHYHGVELTRLQSVREELAAHAAQLTRPDPVAGPPA